MTQYVWKRDFFLIKAGSSTIELIHLCFFFSQKSQDFLTYLLIVTFLIEIIDPLPDEMRIQQLAAAYLPIWSVSKNIWISLKAAVYSLSIEALKRRLDIRLQPHPPAARVSSKTLGLGAPVLPGTNHAHTRHARTDTQTSFKLLDVPEDRGGIFGHYAATATVIKPIRIKNILNLLLFSCKSMWFCSK